MSRVLSLALKINADASGVRLTPVERALKRLGDETNKVTAVFDKFGESSEAAARAQEQTSKSINDLIAARRAGTVTAEEFANQFQAIADGAREEAAALERAARITEQNLTPLERYDRALQELDEQLRAGRISQDTYARATEGAAKGLSDAERAARGLAVQQREIAASATTTSLRFNELSGVFSALPGPLGSIAGRISGLSSAGEGLSRVFSGGVSQGIRAVGSSVAALVNPFTIAAAGIAGFGAAASAIVRGLVDLEARVKGLGAAAEQLGVSFNTIQVLEEAASRAGTSLDAAAAGIQKFATRIDDARKGTGAAAEAFRELGISQEELANTAPTELAGRVAAELSKIEDPARRAALQVDLLGKSGESLRRVFSEIPDAAGDLERFGGAISDEDRERIEALGPAFDGFGVALRALGTSVITPFAGLVTGLVKSLSGIINVVTGVAQALGTVLGPILNAVGAIFGEFGNAINGITGIFREFFGSVDQAAESTKPLEEAVQNAVKFDDRPAKAYAAAVGEINKNLREAFKEANQFGQAGLAAARQYSATIARLKQEFSGRVISEDSFKDQVERATEAYQKQITVIREARAEVERRTQAEIDAVNRIIEANERADLVQRRFGGDDSRARAADNLVLIYKEFERAEAQLARAREISDDDAIRAAEDRLRLLREAALRERDIASGRAAQRKAQEEEAARRVQQNQEIANRRLQAEREVERQIAAERDRVNQFVNEQLALAQFGGNQQRLQAARQVAEIEREIARVQTVVDQARQQGNTQVANAGVARIAQLDQVAAKERDIANGRAEVEARIQEQREKAVEAERLAAEQRQQAIEQQQQAAAQQAEAQRRAFEEQAKAAAAEAERQERRIRALNSIGQQSISVGDIRSNEGANQFIQAAAGAFDPNLAELRAQSKLLRQIAVNSGALQFLERGIGSTFTFLGGGA